jgi:hypothetical protein
MISMQWIGGLARVRVIVFYDGMRLWRNGRVAVIVLAATAPLASL